LTFKHDDSRYTLTRRLTLAQQKLNPKQTDLWLELMRDGQTFVQDRPQQRIQAIVPDGISGFLFFNGERINYLAMERNSAQVTEAIHQMLGLRLLRTTIDDLNHQNVRGKLRAELRETTSEEKRELIERLTERESDMKEREEQRRQTQDNLTAIASEVEAIDNKLAANREAHELQTKRVASRASVTPTQSGATTWFDVLGKLIADDGYTLFATDLLGRGREVVATLRSEGKIPGAGAEQFPERTAR
jgi:DNA sulfur modification protein DndD